MKYALPNWLSYSWNHNNANCNGTSLMQLSDDTLCQLTRRESQIGRFMGPTWGPPGSCRPQMVPMLTPWTLLSQNANRNAFLWVYANIHMLLFSGIHLSDELSLVNGKVIWCQFVSWLLRHCKLCTAAMPCINIWVIWVLNIWWQQVIA